MRRQIVVVGTGGQGIILLARVLAEAGRGLGLPVLAAETHGMAMRGGSVICQVKLGEFASPLVLPGRADLLLGLDAAEAARNRYYLAPGGRPVVNTPLPAGPGEVDALALAQGVGSARMVNMALLGFAAGVGALGLPEEAVRRAIAALSAEKHRTANLAAFGAGRGAAAT